MTVESSRAGSPSFPSVETRHAASPGWMEVGGRRCRVFCAGPRPSVSGDVGDGAGCPLLVQLVSEQQEEDLEREAEMIAAAGMPFTLVAVPVRDWELELMPWAEPAVSKRPEVGTGAGETLRYLERGLLARDNGTQAASLRNTPPVILGGYSLAGLFALWAACQTDRFGAVVAGSPSLWAGDWPGYAAGHAMQARQVYLSLGDREERSRNKTFARVGDRIREEHRRLQQQLGEENTTLVWEEGGHFADPAARMARGFVWCLSLKIRI